MSYSGAAFPATILNSTNFFRAQHQASPLTWNATLAAFAQNHAQTCLWQHSGGPYGENLAENYNTPTLAVDAWAAEGAHYDYAAPGFSEATGHFTQLVWKATTAVGCGAVQCDTTAADGANGWYLVCEYAPPGNVGGEFKTQVTRSGESAGGQLGLGGARTRFGGGGSSSGGEERVVRGLAVAGLLLTFFV